MKPQLLLTVTVITLVISLTICGSVSADELLVPGQYPTIQAAIDDANDGDTVIVAVGTYTENIHFKGKNITLTSTDPTDEGVVSNTIIDGNDANSVVTFSGTENANCQIVGFTITGGQKGIPLRVDLQAEGGDVEPGWTEWSAPEFTSPATIALSTDFDYDFSATLEGGMCLDGGDWQTDYPPGPDYADMFEDGCVRSIFGGIMTLTFSNLNAGSYRIQTFHVDMNHSGGTPKSTFAVRVNGATVVNYAETGGRDTYPWDWDVLFEFTSNGSNDVVIEFDGTAAEPNELDEVWLNGIFLSGSGPLSGGGGIAGNGCLATISNCVITGNWATYGGGLCDCDGLITDNIISDNRVDIIMPLYLVGGGGYGGGLYDCDGTIRSNIISENKAYGYTGGGLDSCDGTISNNLLVDNEAVYGGAFCQCNGSISNCTVVGNYAPMASGLGSCYGSIRNCIIWQNLVDDCNVPSYSCIENWAGGGIGNIDADPCFADADANDFHLKSQAGRWDPNSQAWVTDANTSPGIDSGDMASPVGYEPFPNGGIINMGAYGGTAEASKSYFGTTPCQTIVAGDINGDCKVDFVDFAIMSFHWLEDNNP